jgi:hypothetical protein
MRGLPTRQHRRFKFELSGLNPDAALRRFAKSLNAGTRHPLRGWLS